MNNYLIKYLKKITVKLRHRIVKLIAPKLYGLLTDFSIMVKEYSAVPRPAINFIAKTKHSEQLIGVEIGVADGLNAESIAKTLNMKLLYLVDPYVAYTENGILVRGNMNNQELAQKRLENYQATTQFMHYMSEDAAELIPNELDFVYIDGNHSYPNVISDIASYYPKLKKGGVLCGHDYWFPYESVMRAVDDFSRCNNIKLFTEKADWWLIKQ